MTNLELIRNFGIIAHIDSGKTTTTERILYLTGFNHSIGEVDEGTTTTDWMVEERERGITIQAASVTCNYKEAIFNLIDTPGHVDFTIEVERSLRVLDGVVVIVCGVSGVQTQTITVWNQANTFNLPKIIFINKLDRVGANYFGVVENIKSQFKVIPLILNFGYYNDSELIGIVDLISMKMYKYKNDGFVDLLEDIPEEVKDEALLYREELVNILTRYDDVLLDLVLKESYTERDIHSSIRKLTIGNVIIPVFGGASYKNIGVPNLLDGIKDFLPSPKDRDKIKIYNETSGSWEMIECNNTLFLGYIFKVQYQRERANIVYMRVYSGEIKVGEEIFNSRNGKKERVLDILKILSDSFERVESAKSGDIVALVGIKDGITGDTLSNMNKKIVLEKIELPEPVIFVRIEPKNSVDLEKFNYAINFLLNEDPTLVCREDSETGQTLLGGMGELHLEVFFERLKREFNLELNKGSPTVAHREKVLTSHSYQYTFDNKIAGNIHHATLFVSCEPIDSEECEIEFRIDKEFTNKDTIQHIKRGINNALSSGPSGAYQMVGTKIVVEKIICEIDNHTNVVLEAYVSMSVSYLLREAKTTILEPIMSVEVDSPEANTGSIIGDLQSRGGVVNKIYKKAEKDIIIAKVQLSKMFGYSTAVRNLSSGRATFSMKFVEFG